jgi:hypothetical protein
MVRRAAGQTAARRPQEPAETASLPIICACRRNKSTSRPSALAVLRSITSSYLLPADDRGIDAVVASLSLMYVIGRAAA